MRAWRGYGGRPGTGVIAGRDPDTWRTGDDPLGLEYQRHRLRGAYPGRRPRGDVAHNISSWGLGQAGRRDHDGIGADELGSATSRGGPECYELEDCGHEDRG